MEFQREGDNQLNNEIKTKKLLQYRYLLLIGGVIALLAVGYLGFSQKQQKQTGPFEKINLGVELSLLPAMVWVAERNGYFQEEGLNVNIKGFDSGRSAMRAMLDDGAELDMVTVAQTPFIFNSFKRDDYAMISMMVFSNNDVKVVGRNDRGIEAPSDLRGKKIGVTKGSTGHYFISLFLTTHGLTLSDIELADFKATELPEALADGQVDAISTWEPNVYKAKKLLGEKAREFLEPDIFREDFYFVVKKDFAGGHPGALKRFLKAMEKAEAFIGGSREEAMTIVSERLAIDRELVASIWSDYSYRLLLDQSILLALEDEARWAMKSGFTDKKEVPNYLNFIYQDALKEVKPGAVTIIR